MCLIGSLHLGVPLFRVLYLILLNWKTNVGNPLSLISISEYRGLTKKLYELGLAFIICKESVSLVSNQRQLAHLHIADVRLHEGVFRLEKIPV